MALHDSDKWNYKEKLHGAYCYMHYPTQAQYLQAIGYFGKDIPEGKLAYKKAKAVYKALSKVFTDLEIDKLTDIE